MEMYTNSSASYSSGSVSSGTSVSLAVLDVLAPVITISAGYGDANLYRYSGLSATATSTSNVAVTFATTQVEMVTCIVKQVRLLLIIQVKL